MAALFMIEPLMIGVLAARVPVRGSPRLVPARGEKRAGIYSGWVFFLVSSCSPHVRLMVRTCGEPDEVGLAATGVELNGSRRVHVFVVVLVLCRRPVRGLQKGAVK